MQKLKITSPEFQEGDMIPRKFTVDGANINPEINIENIPSSAQSIVVIIDDPDAPSGTWTHWVVFNIPVSGSSLKIHENSAPRGAILGINDFKQTKYGGPSPPRGKHRYFFKAYALDSKLDLGEGAFLETVRHEMQNHVLAFGELMGVYER